MGQTTIGIVGAGQLARMLIQAAIPLGIRVRLLAEHPADGAARVAADVTIGSPADPDLASAFAATCDVTTFDHEQVPPATLARLEQEGRTLRPSAATMAIAQDKQSQRERFAARGLPVPPFAVLVSPEEIDAFGAAHGWPIVVKAATGGYDGRGVWVSATPSEARAVVSRLIAAGVQPIAEAWVAIDREIAVMVARSAGGEIAVYPPVETIQIDGICRELIAPARISGSIAAECRRIAHDVAGLTGVVGVLAVELFVAGDRVLVNEIATRPHNSGHWTIEGCVISQFEQHLRAILDWPLGATAMTAPHVVTVNLLGGPDGRDPGAELPKALAIDGAHVHLYGKEARPGRKLGHVTLAGDDLGSLRGRAWRAAEILTGLPRPTGA